jgi:hypothetical protein
VTITQPGGATAAVTRLNVSGNLAFQVGNTAGGSARVSQTVVQGNATLQTGDGAGAGSQVYFKESAVFSAGNGKNTKYVGTSAQILSGTP